MEIFWRTLFVLGLIRTKVPFLLVTSQTLLEFEVMPPSESAGPTRRVAVILFVRAFTRASLGGFPQRGTHRLPKLKVRPEQGGEGK